MFILLRQFHQLSLALCFKVYLTTIVVNFAEIPPNTSLRWDGGTLYVAEAAAIQNNYTNVPVPGMEVLH